MAGALPQILMPEGHEPPKPPPPRGASVWLWRAAVLLLILAAVAAVVVLDRPADEPDPLVPAPSEPRPADSTAP